MSLRQLIKDKKEARAKDVSDAGAIITAAHEDGGRDLTSEEEERWQKLHDKLVGIQNATDEDPFGWRHEIPI